MEESKENIYRTPKMTSLKSKSESVEDKSLNQQQLNHSQFYQKSQSQFLNPQDHVGQVLGKMKSFFKVRSSIQPSRKNSLYSNDENKQQENNGGAEQEINVDQNENEIQNQISESMVFYGTLKSQFTFVAIFTILYQMYYLMSEYITVFFFAFITQITLNQYKDSVVSTIIDIFTKNTEQNKLQQCLIGRFIKFLLQTMQNPKEGVKVIQKNLGDHLNVFNFTSNVKYLSLLALLYCIISKGGISAFTITVLFVMLIDSVLRAGMDLLNSVLDKIGLLEKFRGYFTYKYVNPIATNFVIIFFVFSMIMLGLILAGLFGYEMYQIQLKATNQVNQIGETLEEMGLSEYMNKDFIRSIVKEHVDKLDTYIDNSEFKVPIKMVQIIAYDLLNNNTSQSHNVFNHPEESFLPVKKDQDNIDKNHIKTISKVEKYIQSCDLQYKEYSEYEWLPKFLGNFISNGIHSFCYFTSYTRYFEINVEEQFSSIIDHIKQNSMHVLNNIKSILATIIMQFFSVLMVLLDYALLFIVYLVSLNYLLQSKTIQDDGFLKNVFNMIPGDSLSGEQLHSYLQKNIKGVFQCTFDISIYHMILTWMMLDILNCQFVFLSAIIAGIMAIIPIVPVFLITLPHVLYLYLHNQYVYAILLFALYFYLSGRVFVDIYQDKINAHPYLVGISVGFGIYTFGIRGIIYGPLIICIGHGIFTVIGGINQQQQSSPADINSQNQKDKNNNNNNGVQSFNEKLIESKIIRKGSYQEQEAQKLKLLGQETDMEEMVASYVTVLMMVSIISGLMYALF